MTTDGHKPTQTFRGSDGPIVKISRYLKRIIAGDKAVGGGMVSVRSVIVWVFIALVALFLTHPSAEPPSVFSKPIPMPAGLGLQ